MFRLEKEKKSCENSSPKHRCFHDHKLSVLSFTMQKSFIFIHIFTERNDDEQSHDPCTLIVYSPYISQRYIAAKYFILVHSFPLLLFFCIVLVPIHTFLQLYNNSTWNYFHLRTQTHTQHKMTAQECTLGTLETHT